MEGKNAMNIIIVGAGVTGLTLGYLLSHKGYKVTILEKEHTIGGLARSCNYNGWSIDIGPHRFHTDDPLVATFISEIMGDDLLVISRNSKVFFCNQHFEWPLTFSSIFRLPLSIQLKACRDVVFRPRITNESYESYVLSKYGRTLTEYFFREYNQKFLKIDLRDCHKDWAETGINRATIDKDVKTSSIIELLLGVLSTRNIKTKFLYPKTGPIEKFCKKLHEKIKQNGGTIICGVVLKTISIEKKRITHITDNNGQRWDSDFIFWTGTSYELEKLLGVTPSCLQYCSTVLCNLLVEGSPPIPAQWEYFGSRDFVFCRTSINTCFNELLAPRGFYGICAELVCNKDDFVWNKAETLLNSVLQNLIHANIIRNYNSINDVHFERIENTYPVYRLDYRLQIQTYMKNLSEIENLIACGRTGGFWYNNMDHSIRSAIDLITIMNETGFEAKRPHSLPPVFRGNF
ncbi:MAG: FAD-dependent oxidoreductase [Candidatus Omnitrophica bacterium]|nr:FAD-dependent oxidoreductase [Candidatus Omnitrophota bacterium]